ncbi:glycosyl transferase family 2 [Trinickia dabaoshanensis]|uniref:Glycosyl transferase family 2 n=1 Tax=Trinickia dabaoshanensis TaxID=564714 RepID=A0A2N7VDC3_9BURK|nr:glycosyltransferase [Trinickia dabaoshanensis]PMS15127.1 glycosyl transferase family 2 [Trinickia dabaoshanensis]
MIVALFGVSLLSLVIWCVLLFARGGFWRTRCAPSVPKDRIDAIAAWPAVVAVVPARNEADVIGPAVTSLLEQDYAGAFHVIVVDDHSTDGTADCARAASLALGRPERLTVIQAEALPSGWSGKVWAQSQGVAAIASRGLPSDFLLLTDADIGHPADAVTQLVARATSERRDLVSLMVRLRCDSIWEKALIPAFVFFFAKLYPFAWVNDPRNKTAAAAGGCMLVRRDALEEAGGMESIRAALIDDCSLAARIKHRGQGGHPISLDVAARSRSLRPYDGPGEIWNMIARTAFTQLRYSPWLLIGTLIGMTVIYLAPPIVALVLGPLGWPAWLAWGAMCCAYAPMLRYYGRSPLWAPALPLVALFYVGATLASAVRYWRGKGGQWKARVQAPAQGG